MLRKKCLIWLGVILFLSSSIPLKAGNIEPNFLMRLQNMSDDTMVSALVFMSDQVNTQALENSSLSPVRLPRHVRHAKIVNALKTMARETQGSILRQLAYLKGQGRVETYRSFWISNLIYVKARPSVLKSLAQRADVSIVYEDVAITNIQPVSVKPSSAKTRSVEGGIQDINAPQLWAMGITGAGRLVSHLDTGVDGDHPALHDRWRGLQPGVTPDEAWFDPVTHTNYPFDSGSHGTHTMGTMCGRAGSDTIGVAPDAFWISAGVIDRVDIPTTIQDAILAFQWIADPDGDPNTIDDVPDVCSNSWGLSPIYHSQYTYPCDTLFWSYIDNCEAAGVVVVFAAGNEGPDPQTLRTPADRATTLTKSFSVGALEPGSQTIASFSSRGPSPCENVPPENLFKPEVCARGVDVRSSLPGGGYGTMSGTSMACPHVAGAVALLRQVNPDATPDEIKMALLQTAVDLGTPGEDNTYGMGRIDVYAAAQMLGGSKVEGYVTEFGTGDSLEGAHLNVVGGMAQATTDSTGFYRLYVSGGDTYDIAARAYAHRPDTQSIFVPESSTVNLDFVLEVSDSGYFQGYVYSVNDSTPIEGAVVYAVDVPVAPDTTDASGFFSIKIPGGATYTFKATAVGFRYGTYDAFIPEDGTVSHDFYLTPTEDFEAGNGGYSGTGLWEWGVPTSGPGNAHSGTHLWATNLSGDYGNNANYMLYSRNYIIANIPAELSFFQWYDMESGWDGGNVSISTDGGQTWTLLTPEGGYPDNSLPGLGGEPGYSGSTGWTEAVFDISAYVGNTVQFRWRLGSDGSVTRSGWYIDDVTVIGESGVQVYPDIWVSPTSFTEYADVGGIVNDILTIGNSGEGYLSFNLSATISSKLSESMGPKHIKKNTFSLPDKTTKKVNEIEPPKGASEPVYPPQTLGFGGPDQFGYTWIDSDEPGGPTYEWIDITAIGTPLNLGDDDYEQVSLPWTFSFYGSGKSSVKVSSNGYLTFGTDGTDYSNDPIPNTNDPNDFIAPFWDDLNPSTGGQVYYYYDSENDIFIAEWYQVPHYGGGGTYTLEAILYPSGKIEYQYESMSGTLNSATIGIENSTGTDGLQIAYNQNYVHNNLAVLIQTGWLSVSPTSGIVPPDSSVEITVTCDASFLDAGTYDGQITVTSNDPDQSIINIPVTFHVGGYLCGDANGDFVIDLNDLIYLADYLYASGPAPVSPLDPNQDGQWDSADLDYLGAYLFAGGPPPCGGKNIVPILRIRKTGTQSR